MIQTSLDFIKGFKYNEYLRQNINKKGAKSIMEKNTNQDKILQYLVAAEKLGQEIISDRREIVLLDRRRNSNREALRDLKNSGQKKCFITVGSVLVKNNIEQAISLLEADQKQINIDINKMRSDLKVKVNDLRDMEMQPPVPGLSLVPLSEKEKTLLAQFQQHNHQ